MVKKKSSSITGLFKEAIGAIADIGVDVLVGNLRKQANEAMHDARAHVEKATIKVLKAVTVFVIMILGCIMVLVGLGEYLTATIPAFANGVGVIVVGGALLLLGLIIQFFKN